MEHFGCVTKTGWTCSPRLTSAFYPPSSVSAKTGPFSRMNAASADTSRWSFFFVTFKTNIIIKDGTPKIKVKLQVAAKTNVYVQTLLDCCVGEAKSEQFMMVNFKDSDGNLISPRLPNNYKPSCASNYSQNGYLFNLPEGEYTIILVSYLLSTQAPGVVDGRKWMIRTVSPHVSLHKMH